VPALFFSCYPGGVQYYSETDIVATEYDNAFDFSSNKNYFMNDSIYHIVDEEKEDQVDRSYDDAVLERIATHMTSAGYTRIEGDAPDSILVGQADVLLNVIATSTKYTGVGYVPGGGGYWGYPGWGWGGGGYYPGYPWYPGYGWGYPYTYSYSTGSLFIEMVNLGGIDEMEEEIPITWQSSTNGLLSGDQANMEWRIDRAIDQSFEQSPYLSN
jgi:hypothetical protein